MFFFVQETKQVSAKTLLQCCFLPIRCWFLSTYCFF